MNDFDELSRLVGRQRSRRSALAMLGKGMLGAMLAGGTVTTIGRQRAAAADCAVEYPPADLDDCPNKRHHPGNVASSNGCGPANSDFRPPQGFGSVDFRPPCNQHDLCYETCGADKTSCDLDLAAGIQDQCFAGYSSPLELAGCVWASGIYFDAVFLGGGSAYEDAQKKDCECCRPQAPPSMVQPPHVGLQGRHHRTRRPRAPQHVDEPIERERLAGEHQQRREQGPRKSTTEVEFAATVVEHPDRAEHLEPQGPVRGRSVHHSVGASGAPCRR